MGKLPPRTRMGPIQLTISDMERAVRFYREAIGLSLLDRAEDRASLGTKERVLVNLTAVPGATHVPGRSGLYHFALLLPSRQALGSALRNLIHRRVDLTGGADHLVSEALYLNDPDGNGIELYSDKPQDTWTLINGKPQMDTLPLDFEGILAEAGDHGQVTYEIAPGTIMGHMHLHVAHLGPAVDFYRDVIGFDLKTRFGDSAAFLAAGDYHHHLGLNTWAGVGAPPGNLDDIGLRFFIIDIPGKAALDSLLDRLRQAGVSLDRGLEGTEGTAVHDPSGNRILIKSV